MPMADLSSDRICAALLSAVARMKPERNAAGREHGSESEYGILVPMQHGQFLRAVCGSPHFNRPKKRTPGSQHAALQQVQLGRLLLHLENARPHWTGSGAEKGQNGPIPSRLLPGGQARLRPQQPAADTMRKRHRAPPPNGRMGRGGQIRQSRALTLTV